MVFKGRLAFCLNPDKSGKEILVSVLKNAPSGDFFYSSL
jgi:hypothetical protein